ncbi:MAG: 3-hydroxyacyl-CoA dehydrogenase NAD-binding domain-containing protein [Pseudomonadota bacterium]
MQRTINKVAVIGAGTMGAGIAGACAMAGNGVVLLDMSSELAEKAVQRLLGGRNPAISEEAAARIHCGAIDADLGMVADCDWVCEAIIEDLATKRDLFTRLEAVRKDGSIITTNTSGIPLRDIYAEMPGNVARDIAVTHFFNPPHIMRLLELVPGTQTDPDVTAALTDYCGKTLGKGVVNAKDTVNFIGNRIGCFWMLAGLHKAREAADNGVSMEEVDAAMSAPMGLPPTGLYGLVDLIGLDVMDFVGKNLKANLPAGDAGHDYVSFPEAEQSMMGAGQLGRKTGGGFYKLIRHDDGSKTMEVYDLRTREWRPAVQFELDEEHSDFTTLMFADSELGKFSWDLMSAVFSYAADLVPDISDDIVNVDRAMRWGFNWAQGPFEMIDAIGARAFAEKLEGEGRAIPKMVAALLDSDNASFYRDGQFFSVDGSYQTTPAE